MFPEKTTDLSPGHLQTLSHKIFNKSGKDLNYFYMACLIVAVVSKFSILGHILYMRSSDPEEFWPALFEKAYAKYVV